MLKIIIFFLICIGAYTDIRYRKVSNKILLLIILLSLPLIYSNLSNINWLHILFISTIVLQYIFKVIGGADLKAIVPIILGCTLVEAYLLIILLCISFIPLVIKYKNSNPLFLGLMFAYIPIIFI